MCVRVSLRSECVLEALPHTSRKTLPSHHVAAHSLPVSGTGAVGLSAETEFNLSLFSQKLPGTPLAYAHLCAHPESMFPSAWAVL